MTDVIYHYTSPKVLSLIIENQKLRFTNLDFLNDKTEYKYGIQLIKNKILEFEGKYKINDKFNLSLIDRFSFADELFSVSFCEYGDMLGFWNSYYVPKNKGVSIGFYRKTLFHYNQFAINPCIYGNPCSVLTPERYRWFRDIFDRRNIINIASNKEYKQITFQTAHIKEKCFDIEKEWRAVGFVPENIEIDYFERNGKQIPFFDYPININNICKVIVGPSDNQEKICSEIIGTLRDKNLKCEVIKSTIPLCL